MTGERDGIDCVVVGAGVSGMSTAHRLAAAGLRVMVVEADERVGGRAGTVHIDGVPVDRGFQSLFAAYPETRDFLEAIGIGRDELLPLARGAVFHDGASWSRMLLSPGALRRFPALTNPDLARLARLGAEVALRSPASLLSGPESEITAADYLSRRGFSPAAVEGFFRPLFGVITFDRTLASDAAYFRFLLSMLLRGPAVLPAEGHGMICERASADLHRRGGEVRTGARVVEIVGDAGRARGVRLADGQEIAARSVVLAIEAPAARSLLERHDPEAASRLPSAAAGAATLAFVVDRPLYRGRTIVLNSAPADGRPRIDLICQTTNVLRPGGTGPHVVLAVSVTTPESDDPDMDALLEAARELVGRWSPGFDIVRRARHIERVVHPFAQFRVTPGVRAGLPGARTRLPGLLLAGDLTQHPSIEGAVVSGRLAAEAVAEQLTVAP